MKSSVSDTSIFFKHLGQELIAMGASYIGENFKLAITNNVIFEIKQRNGSHATVETGTLQLLVRYRVKEIKMVMLSSNNYLSKLVHLVSIQFTQGSDI